MKRVFLFFASALVCGTMMTSCNKDDSVALTGITVSPASVVKPVDEIQKVTVTAVPENATGVTYAWTSADEKVATVNDEGIVRITGVGETTVTVTSATFTKTIPVEGLIKSLTLKDEAGASTGNYPYNGTDISFTVTATADPVVDVDVEWSSSTGHVKVVGDGMSATVTISGMGATVITAKTDDREWIYNILTSSVFESAVGYWTFEDADLGKATFGEDLKYTLSQFSVVPGPSANKKAVRINHDNNTGFWQGALTYQGFVWNHGLSGESLKNYTILIDARPEAVPMDTYFVVYSANNSERIIPDIDPNNGGCAGVAFRGRPGNGNGDLLVNHAGNNLVWYALDGTFQAGNEPWVRLVFIISDVDEKFPEEQNWWRRAVIDGQVGVVNHHPDRGDFPQDTKQYGNDITNYKLKEGEPVRFMMAAGGWERNRAYDVSTIAVWDHVLTDAEIAALGGVSK